MGGGEIFIHSDLISSECGHKTFFEFQLFSFLSLTAGERVLLLLLRQINVRPTPNTSFVDLHCVIAIITSPVLIWGGHILQIYNVSVSPM